MNISFLNPAVLWLLPAAAIPLALHLLSRRKSRTVALSDLRFLKISLEKVQQRARLRQYLLLLARMLIIALLALAFAQPVLHFGTFAAGAKDDAVSVVLLIDASSSMHYEEAGRSRFDRDKETARRIIDLLPGNARIGCVVYSNRVEAATPSLGNDRNYLKSMIERASCTWRPTDFGAGLSAGEQLLDGVPPGNATVIVLSDLMAHGFANVPARERRLRIVTFAPRGGENIALDRITAEIDDTADLWNIAASGRSTMRPDEPWPVTLTVDGAKKGGDIVRSAKEFTVHFTATPDAEQWTGSVALAPDRLKEDNTLYIAAARPPSGRVWIVDGDPQFGGANSSGFYLKTAFPKAALLPENEIGKERITPPGVLVCTNLRDDHPEIDAFAREGGGVIFFCGTHTGGQFERQYLPALIGAHFRRQEGVRLQMADHPLLVRFPADEFDWGKVAVAEGVALEPKEEAIVLATFSSGSPFIVEKEYGKGKVLLFASTADREWNNLPGRPLYAPFLKALAGYAAGEQQKADTMITIGGVFRKSGVANAMVQTPDGRRIPVQGHGGEILFQDTDVPGIYRVAAEDGGISAFAVNPDPHAGESDLTPVNMALFKDRLQARAFVTLPALAWERRLNVVLSGKDVSRALFVGIILLLIAEIMLANPKGRIKKQELKTGE